MLTGAKCLPKRWLVFRRKAAEMRARNVRFGRLCPLFVVWCAVIACARVNVSWAVQARVAGPVLALLRR